MLHLTLKNGDQFIPRYKRNIAFAEVLGFEWKENLCGCAAAIPGGHLLGPSMRVSSFVLLEAKQKDLHCPASTTAKVFLPFENEDLLFVR